MTERELIYNEIVKFYKFWDDEMSSDAREWIDDILNMLRKPEHYTYLYEEPEDD